MSQLSVAASAGDPSARARLEAWEEMVLKYQPEAQRLSIAAGAGDMGAVQKLAANPVRHDEGVVADAAARRRPGRSNEAASEGLIDSAPPTT